MNLAQTRVRTVNQLHALLRDLLPGGAPTQLSADLAAKLLRSVRPAGDVETVRKDIAGDLVAEIRKLDKQLTDNAAWMQSLVEASGSALMDTPGIGPVMAARLIGRTRRAHRFPTSAAFANYAGAAPGENASRSDRQSCQSVDSGDVARIPRTIRQRLPPGPPPMKFPCAGRRHRMVDHRKSAGAISSKTCLHCATVRRSGRSRFR